jgi:hypothetical protein
MGLSLLGELTAVRSFLNHAVERFSDDIFFVIPSCDDRVKALKQGWSGWKVGPPYQPLDYSRF